LHRSLAHVSALAKKSTDPKKMSYFESCKGLAEANGWLRMKSFGFSFRPILFSKQPMHRHPPPAPEGDRTIIGVVRVKASAQAPSIFGVSFLSLSTG
jgi:hypothetical protein